jgi:hypothetical protein
MDAPNAAPIATPIAAPIPDPDSAPGTHRSEADHAPHDAAVMACRAGCGACCIAPSIATPMPGMPRGKPAGVRCDHLAADLRCRLFGRPDRPAFCAGLQPSHEMCGESREQAIAWIARLERATAPRRAASARPGPGDGCAPIVAPVSKGTGQGQGRPGRPPFPGPAGG